MHAHVDGKRAACSDSKGHSGLFFTMGTGAVINVSKKLGVGDVSSVKTELVSIGERFLMVQTISYYSRRGFFKRGCSSSR